MEYLRVSREARRALIINDPRPVDNIGGIWTSVGRAATVGTFLLLFGTFLYVGRVLVLPIMAAAIVALTLAPLVRAGKQRGISPWITALLLVVVCLGAVAIAATAMAGPVSEWIGRAPEIGATIKQRLSAFDQPLAALRQLQDALFGGDSGVSVSTPAANFVLPVVAFFTPAAGELLLFFGTLLFFLGGQFELRASVVSLFGSRDAKLRFLKIMNDIEKNLAGYLTVVTMINAALGTIVALGAWLLGLPNPVIFGLLAGLLNYVPYVGPAVTVVILFGSASSPFPRSARRSLPRRDSLRSPPLRDTSSRRRSSAGGLRSIRSWSCWRSPFGPGFGGRSAPSWRRRCASSASSSLIIYSRPTTVNFPIEWNFRRSQTIVGAT